MQSEQSREQDGHRRELADVHRLPRSAGRVFGEHHGVVVRRPIGMQQGDDDEQDLSDKQQRGGQPQGGAIDHGDDFDTVCARC